MRMLVKVPFLLLITWSKLVQCSDIFHGSTATITEIVKAETEIANAVREYVSSLETRMLIAKRYLDDYHGSVSEPSNERSRLTKYVISPNDKTSSDPLRMYKLIRRFVSTLPQLEKQLHQDHERNFLRVLENERRRINLPQKSDLNAVTEGILRVHDAYDLDVFQLTVGNFDGLQTNSSLNAADCFSIGSYSLQANIFTRAIEWLERSYHLVKREKDDSISLQTAREELRTAIVQHNQAWQSSSQRSPYVFRDLVDPIPTSGKQIARHKAIDKAAPKLYMTKSSFMDLTNFATLCRNKEKLQVADSQKKLKCRFHSASVHTVISPLKVEVLHEDPSVIQIYDALPSTLAKDIIIQAQKSTLSRSKVHGKRVEPHKVVSASRTSSSTWIHEPKILRRLSNVYQSLQSVLGLDLLQASGALEDFQVSSYGTTGHYNPHLDNILTSEFVPGMNKEELEKGDRLATLMFYLSNAEKGGMSAFPRLGIAAEPQAGAALFWFNMKRNGEVEPLSLHGGCPILFGNKWIANQWIRSNSQMFVRKCDKIKR